MMEPEVPGGGASSVPPVRRRPFGGIDLDGPMENQFAAGAYILARSVGRAVQCGDLTAREAVDLSNEALAAVIEAQTAAGRPAN